MRSVSSSAIALDLSLLPAEEPEPQVQTRVGPHVQVYRRLKVWSITKLSKDPRIKFEGLIIMMQSRLVR
jgi:hypothetical protein